MSFQEYIRQEYPDSNGCAMRIVGAMALFAATLIAFSMLTGCKSVKPVVVPQTHNEHHATDSTATDRQRDSIIIRDSVFIREKGDTVYKYVEHTVWQWRDKEVKVAVHDTLHAIDSIPYPVEVQVPVRIRNGYDRFTSWGFWILAVLIVVVIAIRLWMRFYGLKR